MIIVDIQNASEKKMNELIDYLNRNDYIGFVKGIRKEHIPQEANYLLLSERKIFNGDVVKIVECMIDRFHQPFISIDDLLATEPREMTISEIENQLNLSPGTLRIKK